MRRKVSEENRESQERWTNDYFFVHMNENALCLLCMNNVAVLKEFNLKRHYETMHQRDMINLPADEKTKKIETIKKALKGQQSFFFKFLDSGEKPKRASYAIADKIARESKPFSDGEFIKECIEEVIKIMCPEKSKEFAKVCLSRRTITRRIEDINNDVVKTLRLQIGEM